MKKFNQPDANTLEWRGFNEILKIEAWGPDGLRVRAVKNRDFIQSDWALLPAGDTDITTKPVIQIFDSAQDKDENQNLAARITNGKITASVSSAGKITFTDSGGKLLLEEYVRSLRETGGLTSSLRLDAREYKGSPYGNFRLTQRFESDRTEKLYGMGQYQQDFLNIKGCTLELAQRNSQASVPFLVSDKGYALLWNNPAVGKAVLGLNMTEFSAESSAGFDYWITAGGNFAKLLENYTAVTGRPPMMPDYAAGFWQCKLRYQTQEELLNVAREYKRRGLPLSVIVIDFFHWTRQGDWKFDKRYWPDPAAMNKELEDMGVKLVVSVWPTVEVKSENYNEMLESGYLIQTERGANVTMGFGERATFYDVTNPAARDYVWSKIKTNYYDYGIKNFWLDVAEPEYLTYDFDNYRYYSGTALETGNIYPLMYAKNFYDGLKNSGEKDIISLIRCAWAGSQRYGALVWSGDIHSNFESMRSQFAAGLNMGLSGIPWWTTDIGGFQGADISDPGFKELLIRWFQYGTFCPVMRLHGFRKPIQRPIGADGGGMQGSGAANEVWSFGEDTLAILKKYLILREKLRPYIMAQMKQAHEKGSPIIRPLFYDFPDDLRCWNAEDQYMFGPDIMVAPVMYAGVTNRKVYLPASCNWTRLDIETAVSDTMSKGAGRPADRCIPAGELFNGGAIIYASAQIDDIPVYVREGALL
ncbi:MAG: family 31 glucosidase [Treponema sp.]|nr:family 31 glucosidase [Treponema sp.]